MGFYHSVWVPVLQKGCCSFLGHEEKTPQPTSSTILLLLHKNNSLRWQDGLEGWKGRWSCHGSSELLWWTALWPCPGAVQPGMKVFCSPAAPLEHSCPLCFLCLNREKAALIHKGRNWSQFFCTPDWCFQVLPPEDVPSTFFAVSTHKHTNRLK